MVYANKAYLPRLAEKDIFKFWNDLSFEYKESIKSRGLDDVIRYVILEKELLEAKDLANLYKFSKEYPGSYIINAGGIPVLNIVLRKA